MKYRCESEILAEPPTGIRGAGALRRSAWKANSSLRGRRLKGIPLPFRTPSTQARLILATINSQQLTQ